MKKILFVLTFALVSCQKEEPTITEEVEPIEVIQPTLDTFQLNGNEVEFLIKDEEYEDPGVDLMISGKNIEAEVESKVLNKNIGTYSITYSIPNDQFDNTLTRKVIVVNSDIPVELLNTTFTTEVGSPEYNAITKAKIQDNTIYSMEIENSNLQLGENQVSILYKSKRLDAEIEYQINVKVVDTVKPILESPKSTYTHPKGQDFLHNVVSVEEASEFELTHTGEVDTNSIGTYEVVYTATDSVGNKSEPISITIEVVEPDQLNYFEQYMFDNTLLYDPEPFQNNYMYDLIEWAYRGVVIEENKITLKYFFFLHNEIDGDKVLSKIGFGSSDGDYAYSLSNNQTDFVFEMPLHIVRSNYIRMYTFAHEENDNKQREWVADFSFNSSENLSVEHILSLPLKDGAKK